MSRTILAFLAVAATASGQDTEAWSRDVRTLAKTEYSLRPDSYGYYGATVVQRASPGYSNHRQWVNFDLRDVQQEVRSAVLHLSFDHIHVLGRPPWRDNLLLTFRDAVIQEQFYAHNRPPDEVWEGGWDDVATGAYYGSLDLSTFEGWTGPEDHSFDRFMWRWLPAGDAPYNVSIPLSAAAVRDINEATSSEWSLGISFPDVDIESLQNPGLPPGNYLFERSIIGVGVSNVSLYYGDAPPLGDIDGTGRVDQADLDTVLLRWGLTEQQELDAVLMTWGQGQGLGVITAVPEPSTWLLACVIMAAWAGHHYKMQRFLTVACHAVCAARIA